MTISVYGNIYTHLDNIQALYSNAGGEMCSLGDVCENLTPVLEYLGNDHPRLFADVTRFFLACLDQMYDIVFREENVDLREEGLEDL
ncbi:hypothetical protein TNCV_2914741 [Trichonephila clavipes]|nr:hypothetical protein TNCV_2914741 [Trichonephila clavipes]